VYAIVRAGGRQEKVAVGDVISVDRLAAQPGAVVQLPVVMLVDGATVTAGADCAGLTVSAEVVAATKGPKIDILKYKNKTGYRRRQGYRSKLTELRVTEVAGTSASASTTSPKAAKAAPTPTASAVAAPVADDVTSEE